MSKWLSSIFGKGKNEGNAPNDRREKLAQTIVDEQSKWPVANSIKTCECCGSSEIKRKAKLRDGGRITEGWVDIRFIYIDALCLKCGFSSAEKPLYYAKYEKKEEGRGDDDGNDDGDEWDEGTEEGEEVAEEEDEGTEEADKKENGNEGK